MSRPKTTGDRYRLGEPTAGMLADYCAAMFGPPEIEVIRQALKRFIVDELKDNPGIKQRFDENRRKRLDGAVTPLKSIDKKP